MQRNIKAFGPYLGLAVLAAVGCLVALSAPSRTPVTQAAPPPVTQAHRALAGASPAATDTASATATDTPAATDTPTDVPTATVAPLATDTPAPQPTATDTPAPQPTATSVPQPTPTAAPSWHLVGNYSGSTVQTLATFSTVGTVRVDWTCQDTQSLPTWQLAFSVENYAGSGEGCQPGQLSGTWTFTHLPDGTVTVDVSGGCSGTGCPPIGPWTAAVYAWS